MNSLYLKELYDAGMILCSFEELLELGEMPRNPVTGEPDMDAIQKMLSDESHLSPGAKAQLVHYMRFAIALPDIDRFDIQSLVVLPGTEWIVEVLYIGHVGPDGQAITVDYDTGNATPGAQARYSYRCVQDNGPQSLMSFGRFRQVSSVPDELTAEKLKEFFRNMIIRPNPPATPCLPACLILPIKVTSLLKQDVRHFLDSLPAPFTWRIQSTSETEAIMLTNEYREKLKLGYALKSMNTLKGLGNNAFRKGDRDMAIQMYTETIMYRGMEDTFMGIFTGQEEDRKKVSAIAYSNRAAAHLLPGEGFDPVRAIKDAEEAEKLDPTFKKAYIRQARGYTMLNDMKKAKEVLNRALAREDMANDPDLLEVLNVLQLDDLKFSS